MFNLQSGSYRQSFPARDQRANIKSETKLHPSLQSNNTKHTKAVTGLAIDGLNQVVVSCGLDGKIKVSNRRTCIFVAVLTWNLEKHSFGTSLLESSLMNSIGIL